MSEVVVTRSDSGQWWMMAYHGKKEITDEEPTEAQKKLFRQSVDRQLMEAKVVRRGHSDRITISPADR